jgi:hypothetical protein
MLGLPGRSERENGELAASVTESEMDALRCVAGANVGDGGASLRKELQRSRAAASSNGLGQGDTVVVDSLAAGGRREVDKLRGSPNACGGPFWGESDKD